MPVGEESRLVKSNAQKQQQSASFYINVIIASAYLSDFLHLSCVSTRGQLSNRTFWNYYYIHKTKSDVIP